MCSRKNQRALPLEQNDQGKEKWEIKSEPRGHFSQTCNIFRRTRKVQKNHSGWQVRREGKGCKRPVRMLLKQWRQEVMVVQTGCSKRKKGDMNDYQVFDRSLRRLQQPSADIRKTVNRVILGRRGGALSDQEFRSEYVEQEMSTGYERGLVS